MTPRFTPEEFKDIYSRVPRLAVELVVVGPEGVLLALRSLPTWHNQWHLPGGTLLYGETIAEGIARVARDEVGIEVSVERFLGYNEYPSEHAERGWGQSVGLIFRCRMVSGVPRPDDSASEVRFFKQWPEGMNAEHRAFLNTHRSDV